jgi:5-methylcytosine-specific restriction protein B
MSKKEERENKLSEICKRISKLTYKDLQDEFPTEFKDKINTEKEQSTDLTVESRIDKYNKPKTIDDLGKSTLKYVIDVFKNSNLKFQNSDTEKIQYFTSKINTLLQGTNYSGVGIDNRINLIKDGPNNDVKGHSINLVELFNDFKEYDNFSDFIQKSSIDKAFIENKTFLSHIRYLYSICKGCEDINKYPLYYKQWQLFGLWFFGIARHDYDSFCNHYNILNDIGEPKLLNFACYYYLIGLKLKTDEQYKLLINESEKEKNIIEELIWADKFPSEPSVNENNPEDQMMNKEIQFKEWLIINMPKSADKYFSYFNTANKISQVSKLGNLFLWSKEDWADLESKLREVPDFIDKNSSGHNSLTASIGQYKKFMNMENNNAVVSPIIKYPDYKWFWATITAQEGINNPDIILGVLKLLGEFENEPHGTKKFKDALINLETTLKLKPRYLSKDPDELNRNIIESNGQYWKALGLIDNNGKRGYINLTDFGRDVSKGKIDKEQFSIRVVQELTLPNEVLTTIYTEDVVAEWKKNDLVIKPLNLIIEILLTLYYSYDKKSQAYLTKEELSDIILPIAADTPRDINKYCNSLINYRSGNLNIIDWPKYYIPSTPEIPSNDLRYIKEFLTFLVNYGFVEVLATNAKEERYYITAKARNIFSNSISLEKVQNKLSVLTSNNLDLKYFKECTDAAGLIFSPQLIQRFVASLCTKPFVICSGLSGSGKTKLAQAFVQWITESENQYKIIPVGADWTNREPLLGYPNGLDEKSYVTPDSGVLELIIDASKEENQNKPYFMILDEMNLSHVERYFADFLSIMESGDSIKLYSGADRVDSNGNKIDQEIFCPKNLFIIGTVNIDETTYMFSPKVLDRANVIEFRITPNEMQNFFKSRKELNMKELFTDKDKSKGGAGQSMGENFFQLAEEKTITKIPEIEGDDNILNKFFEELQIVGSEFGYRSATEIELLITKLGINGLIVKDGESIKNNTKIDIAIMQKLLPKLHGSRKKLVGPLETLAEFCLVRINGSQPDDQNKTKTLYQQFISEKRDFAKWEIKYSISFEKIERMLKNVIENGFTSYAEA